MTKKSFLKSGHKATLISALLYFDVSFMVWVILGPLAPFLRQQFGLSATAQGLLVAVPSTPADAKQETKLCRRVCRPFTTDHFDSDSVRLQ